MVGLGAVALLMLGSVSHCRLCLSRLSCSLPLPRLWARAGQRSTLVTVTVTPRDRLVRLVRVLGPPSLSHGGVGRQRQSLALSLSDNDGPAVTQ
jgi:hypothetical protein